jgi:Domain of unknown function (DUF5916)
MQLRIRVGVTATAALLCSSPAISQGTFHGRQNQLSARIPVRDESAVIDGVLDEPAWQGAARLTGFSSYLPFDGRPAQDSTEILVWYSTSAIYFGIRAFETHGPVHATLAARDRIDSDDYIQLLIDPFNDRRRAFIFGVNPLGVQSDGTRTDGGGSGAPNARGQTFGGNPPANIDLSTDFVFDSRGRVTDTGYEIEVRIPLTSIRFQGTDPQDWAFQAIRFVQHSGYQQTWTPARRGASSLLTQSGTLSGFAGLGRDQVVEITPEFTSVRGGQQLATGWSTSTDHSLGGNLRWRVIPNLTINATVRPDFSQVEADAAQIAGDARFALFFPEKRPFFVDGIEQFETPDLLIYTRRLLQPDAAVKASGKFGNMSVALMSALDSRDASLTGEQRPWYNLLRVRRDILTASNVGFTLTDRTEGDFYNRVAAADTRILFKREYSFSGHVAASGTRDLSGTRNGPLFNFSTNRTGLKYGFLYSFNGVSPEFAASSGFVPRNDFVKGSFYNRISFYGKPGSFLETWLIRQGLDGLWLYDKFWDGAGVQETKFQLENVLNLRGGWIVSLTPVTESFLFDPRRYAPYSVETPNDTVAFTPSPRTQALYGLFRVNTPQYSSFSGRFTSFIGRDVDFFETAPAHRADFTADVDFRPSDQLRLTTSYLYSRITRWRDNSLLSKASVPRLKVEYQLSRPLFLRFVGQYDNRHRDALRDPATDQPLLINGVVAAEQNIRDFRVDWLVSYLPSPGTVVFAGYGASLWEPDAFRFRDMERVRDGFFLKLSYVFRP